ncbi:hypothetical protein D3C72_2156220 [compost metagenome]
MAGSIPTLFKISGIPAPVMPAIIRFPVIARKITRPSIGFPSKKKAKINTINPLEAPLIKPTVNSFKTVR